jgi:hypothetical protein
MSDGTARNSTSPSNHSPLVAESRDREPVTSSFEQESRSNPTQLPPSQVGIDDITIAARIPELTEPRPGFMPMDPVRGRPDRLWASRADGALYITHCPATQIVTLRISGPRWIRGTAYNYPLAPLQSVDDLRPRDLARELAAALSVRVSFIGNDVERRFPVRIWPVLRVAYACDLHVIDPLTTIAGCRVLRRRHQARVQTFGLPVSTLQWASRHLRVQLYAKAVELESRRRTTAEAERAELDALVKHAQHVLRFEVTLLGARAIRDLLWLRDGSLPPLQVMCDPVIAQWAITTQVDRLRLRECDDAPSIANLADRSRQLRARLDHEFRCPSGRLLRTKRLTRARMERLAIVYFLGCGHRLQRSAEVTRDRSREVTRLRIAISTVSA